MRKFFLLVSLVSIAVTGLGQRPVFRWDVKTLTDSSDIDWLQKLEDTRDNQFATIEGLTKKAIQFKGCNSSKKNTRRSDEKRVVKLKIRLIKVKRESNDEDYHIVIQSLTNSRNKMVAELPDPAIEEYEGDEYEDLREIFAALRTKVEELLQDNVTTVFKNFPANTIVTIYGVPFYDCKHPGTVSGASKNFREIHPVLDIDEE